MTDKKKQSEALSAAVAEFNKSMKALEIRLNGEIRSKISDKPSVPSVRSREDDLSLRLADASRFLEESGI